MPNHNNNEKNERNVEQAYLIIASGTHVGARFNLFEDHRYTIGSCVSSDIVVFDESVVASHLSLEMHGGVASVTSGDGEVAVNGSVLKKNVMHVCTPNCSIEFGNSSFYIVLSDQHIGSFVEGDSAYRDGVANKTVGIEKPKFGILRSSILGVGAVFAMVLSATMITSYSSPLVAETEHQLEEDVNQDLMPLALEKLSVSVLPSGKIHVDGYTVDDQQLAALLAAMEKYSSRIVLNVVSDEKLLMQANDLLSRFSSSNNVRAVSSVEGNMVFSGAVLDDVSWRHVIANVRRDLSDIKSVDDKDVLTLLELKNEIKNQFNNELPHVVLEITTVDSNVLIRGIAETSIQLEIKRIADKLVEKYGGRISLVVQLAAASSDKEDIRVTTIDIGSISYFVTNTGDKYLIGAQLSSGHTVMSIEHDRVLLVKNGEVSIHLIGSS